MTLGKKIKKRAEVAPILTSRRKRAKTSTVPKVTTWKVTKQKTWDIGDGPWFWNGVKASRPEYITLIMLKKLGWTNIKFQTDILGGRKLPGGQVLDIVIEDAPQPVYISVKGYYHQGAKAAYEDKLKELIAQTVIGARIIEIWEQYIDQPGWLEQKLRQDLGVRGR